MTDEQFAQFQVRKGDVLLNEGQSIELVGRCAIYQDEYHSACAIQNALLRFRAKPGVCEKFASYVFRHCQHTGVFARIALQTTSIAHLGGSRFERLMLAWPNEAEQRAIAEALSDVDELLGALDRLIAKKRDLKQAAMQQLLTGQTRLPGFSGKWEEKLFSQHFRIYAGGDVPKNSLSQAQTDAFPYPIFANAIQDKGLYGFTNEHRSPADSITITARGYLGHAEYRDRPFFPIVRLLVFEPIGLLDPRFTTYAINNCVEFAIESTGVPQLTVPQVCTYGITAPPTLCEQTAIAEVLSDMGADIAALEQRREKTRALKQGMMQELLTGRTRLISRAAAKNANQNQ
jgi:type I restriction enzyme, S subunit